ncbi:MAG: hypothetical protein DRJ03_25845 [Chloroflexi bacterium]|nr:MAG: hypothetical protein DRI81_17375 [Chloroflexota bacterium]RLC78044.1 MAG: hypothetical protein DRJ03_25845 [Chloroflexota bacterium]
MQRQAVLQPDQAALSHKGWAMGTSLDRGEVSGHDAILSAAASVGGLIVGQSVASQEYAQELGLGWVTQPDQGFSV